MNRVSQLSPWLASWWIVTAIATVAAPDLALAGPGKPSTGAAKDKDRDKDKDKDKDKDPPAKDSAKAEAIGRAHFQRGQKLSAQGDYEAAYTEFEAGYNVTGRSLFLFNMAEAARAAGDLARAKDNYLEFLRVEPKSALAATAQARLADIDRATGVAPPPAPEVPPPTAPPPSPPPSVLTAPPATTASQPLPAAPAPASHGSLVHKWPFWAGVAGVIVAGGAIAYVATRTTTTPACPAGCTTLDLRGKP